MFIIRDYSTIVEISFTLNMEHKMHYSVFDIFKISIGPSSSHTMGPMLAALRFLRHLKTIETSEILTIKVKLFGSLAYTGKGHATDRAIILGLMGYQPDSLDDLEIEKIESSLFNTKQIKISETLNFTFTPETDIVFDTLTPFKIHPNEMHFFAYNSDNLEIASEIYCSVGGGSVVSAREFHDRSNSEFNRNKIKSKFPFNTANELLALTKTENLTIEEVVRQNEYAFYDELTLNQKLGKLWEVMSACVDRGLEKDGVLPGGLNVKRRAKYLYNSLSRDKRNIGQFSNLNEWLSLYAMAVNEENACGGQLVTAPTNGAAGVIPAVIKYHMEFNSKAQKDDIFTFLLTASAIGSIIKHNASISGAEVGCQGEVGSASAMAAAGLCAVLRGSPEQIENAAEIALEHHLGLTCDPIKGLVQVPCIERNGLGAVKAFTAASLALRGDGQHIVPLDNCIETMRQTGQDMSERYKETSQAGLAVNLPEC